MLKKLSASAAPLIIFAVNCAIVWRLIRAEYLNQFLSIEGSFIGLASYIRRHWPVYGWFPVWFGGYPFPRSYQPALHYCVALLSAISGWSVASSYHFTVGIAYALGAVGFYFLTLVLSRHRPISFCAALLYSLFSPSLVFLPLTRQDAGGLWTARRLQTLVFYGEGPNNTGLMAGLFALALFHVACTRRSKSAMVGAAVAIALVIATNWPATIAMFIALISYSVALRAENLKARRDTMLLIGLMAFAMALPFALPSTIFNTFFNANSMEQGSTPGSGKWILASALVIALFMIRRALIEYHVALEIRFAVINLTILAWIVFGALWTGTFLVPQPMRFHIALETPVILLTALLVREFLRRRRGLVRTAAAAFALFCCIQFVTYLHYARTLTPQIDIRTSLEYQESKWLDENMKGERVLVPGTVAFWLNVFTETPQLTGCCDQSLINPLGPMIKYIIAHGYRDDAESSYYSLLWMKAWAVRAFAIGGPLTREQYKDFAFPNRFEGQLPVAWVSGDDRIYRIPGRAPGLVRVVKDAEFVVHRPVNGVDDHELKTFVAALDDASLPVVQSVWRNAGRADISGNLAPGQSLSVAVNYDPGWRVLVNGARRTVQSDGLGLVKLVPHCAGKCDILLQWSPGLEPWLVCCFSLLALIACGLWLWRGFQPAEEQGLRSQA